MKVILTAKSSLICLLLLFCLVTAGVAPVRAQEAGSAPSAEAAGGEGAPAKAAPKNKTVIDIWNDGGIVMYFLAIASICMVGFTIEGFIKLNTRKLAPPALIARLREAISSGNYQEAWTICKANKSFLSSVLASGLERIGRSKDAVDFAIQEAANKESTILKTNTTFLSVIGVVTPMIGLTGTVTGMIKAFSTLGASGIGDPSKLAAAIGEVLIATASGLVVAIPAFIFFYILKAKAQAAILVAESEVYHLLEDIPYEQLSGIRIGENFSADTSARRRSMASQPVSMSMTTNCPSCNFQIAPGTTPCPNCGTVLEWGA